MAIRLKRNKYGAKPCIVDGKWHASGLEGGRVKELRLLEKAKVITGLKLQVVFSLMVNGIKVGTYRADAVYLEAGKVVIEDAKGATTPLFVLKWAIMKAMYPNFEFREVRGIRK